MIDAARYAAKGRHDEAAKVLSGEATPYFLLRHEEERLKREAAYARQGR